MERPHCDRTNSWLYLMRVAVIAGMAAGTAVKKVGGREEDRRQRRLRTFRQRAARKVA